MSPATGPRNKPIVILQQSCDTDPEYGSPVDAWKEVRRTMASIKAATSREIYALGAGFTAQVTHKIAIHWTPTVIRSGMRVMYGQRFFTIQAVSDPDEGRRELNLMCLEINEGQ